MKKIAVKGKLQKERKIDTLSRYLNPNLKWRRFAWDRGVTIYATAQSNNNVKIFAQKGESFRKINDTEYDQNNPNEVKEYCAEIDRQYEAYYKKNYKNDDKE